MRIVMLTRDTRTTAEAVARKLGIDDEQADVCPRTRIASFAVSGRRATLSPWRATA